MPEEASESASRPLPGPTDSSAVEEQVFDAARTGDVDKLALLLDEHPDKLDARARPYEFTLLHLAAQHLAAVDFLLKRGVDVNAREKGDNTYAMHWAAAGGKLDVVRRLADAGGDVVGHGDDHELEVIGWATCWNECDDDAHHAVADFLVSRGAQHHIFSAIAMNLADEVRRIVAFDPSALNHRMSHNENQQLPLHFAVRMNRPEMISLLLELGADPLGGDGSGLPAAAYAMEPEIDRDVMKAIRVMTSAELLSAERGHRALRGSTMDLLAALALGDWEIAERLVSERPELLDAPGGVLHLMAKRDDVAGVKWLLERGSSPNALWNHWDSEVTPLHLAVLGDHPDTVRALLDGGADPHIRDTKHESDAIGWAEFFQRQPLVRILTGRTGSGPPAIPRDQESDAGNQ